MRGDGDGWVECGQRHRHWGRYGAAGLLLRYVDSLGTRWVLLQHRAEWSHHGGTWGLPGGARDSHETAEETALRESAEETGLDAALVRVLSTHRDDHGGWSYDTVVADCFDRLEVRPIGGESIDVRWVPESDAASMPLHPGLAASWARVVSGLRGLRSGSDDGPAE